VFLSPSDSCFVWLVLVNLLIRNFNRHYRKVSYLHLEMVNCIGTFLLASAKKKFRPRNFDLNIMH
jgi:hypothetical protein